MPFLTIAGSFISGRCSTQATILKSCRGGRHWRAQKKVGHPACTAVCISQFSKRLKTAKAQPEPWLSFLRTAARTQAAGRCRDCEHPGRWKPSAPDLGFCSFQGPHAGARGADRRGGARACALRIGEEGDRTPCAGAVCCFVHAKRAWHPRGILVGGRDLHQSCRDLWGSVCISDPEQARAALTRDLCDTELLSWRPYRSTRDALSQGADLLVATPSTQRV